MASLERQPGAAYEIGYDAVPLESVANKARQLPRDYITDSGNDIREEYRAYAEPLAGGPLAGYASLDAAQPEHANFPRGGQ